MVQALLALGVDASVQGENGTALQVAEKFGFDEVCQILTGKLLLVQRYCLQPE
jgi:hypothetical protein